MIDVKEHDPVNHIYNLHLKGLAQKISENDPDVLHKRITEVWLSC